MLRSRWWLAPVLFLATAPTAGSAQTARISEDLRTLSTYPFSEPNPVPILGRDDRLYPYHSFEGYSTTAQPQDWTVVTLENELIQVFVLPQVGGKVWGAVVKETGHEFIYRNEVMKFRNISLRGPWTSGGIEFNFGVIGHTPATATPVDYRLVENDDGSVSCWVGGIDLPSRTHWRVEVRLAAGRASFDTNVFWTNPTPLEQPYYNWMTAAAFAQDDLELAIPGNAYLEHSGNVLPWPEDDEARYLPLYRNNTFDGHKSYHVVGELNDFFGGYYLDEDYGFGHWARHEDMPGQKLWLWALSRQGGVWEDLLTDTDGQYVEFQAGRLFVQYSPGPEVNPITQAAFDPLSQSRWSESWFPLEGIGGLTDASRDGAMHLEREGERLHVAINAFRDGRDTLRIWSGESLLTEQPVSLNALEPRSFTFDLGGEPEYRVQIPGLDLDYDSDPSSRNLARPFATEPPAFDRMPATDRTVFESRELMKGRWYDGAREGFEEVLAGEPYNREALLGLSELEYRAGRYGAGLDLVNRALQMDAYDARANFQAGYHYRALGRVADARDALGWAARSTAYRSGAFVQLARIMIGQGDLPEAGRYARLALDYDRYSLPALQAVATIGRISGDGEMAERALARLASLDPLSHFVPAERYLADPDSRSGAALTDALGGEYPDQTLLELAIDQAGQGREADALRLLKGAGTSISGAVMNGWAAWLAQDASALDPSPDPAFQFPFRPETLTVLTWAAENANRGEEGGAWVWDYLLALNLWAVGRTTEAAARMEGLGQAPDYGPSYVARARLLEAQHGTNPLPDLRRAVALDPESRLLHVALVQSLEESGRWDGALDAVRVARTSFPSDFNLALLQARAQIHTGGAAEAAELLGSTHVLPSENARESHLLYEQAHTLAALDARDAGDLTAARLHLLAALDWPESLGQGRPYDPEERLVRFLLGQTEARLGNTDAAEQAYQAVVDASPGYADLADLEGAAGRPQSDRDPTWRLDLLALASLQALDQTAALASVPWAIRDQGNVGEAARALVPQAFDDLEGAMILRALAGP